MPKVILIIPMIILGLIFLQGLLYAINPKFLWKIFGSWKATKEPSEAYFIIQRISGIVMMIIILGIFLVPYLMRR